MFEHFQFAHGFRFRGYRLPILVICFIAVTACQTAGGPPALSLEQAKQVTTTFKDTSFTPPPRTITGITDILNQQEVTNRERVESLLSIANAPVPETTDAAVLAKHFLAKGTANKNLGRSSLALENFRKAFKHQKSAQVPMRDRMKVVQRLASLEAEAGNLRTAIRYKQKSVAGRPSVPGYRGLVAMHAKSGNFKAAEAARDEGKILILKKSRKKRGGGGGASSVRLAYEAEIMDSMVYAAKGQWSRAENALRRAIDIYTGTDRFEGDPSWLASQKKTLAKYLRKQKRLIAAEVMAREALLQSLSQVGRNNTTTAATARELAEVLQAQGRTRDAEKLALAVVDIYKKIGMQADSRSLSMARKFLAGAYVSQGKWAAALKIFDRLRVDLKDNRFLYKKLFASPRALSIALMHSKRTDEALRMLAKAYRKSLSVQGPKHKNTATLRALLAMAQVRSGAQKKALEGFASALPILLSRSRASDDDDSSGTADEQRLRMVLESYLGLLADIRGTPLEHEVGIDVISESFRIADIARDHAVQNALAASGARSSARDPALADIARREQDTQKQIGALYALLADILSRPTEEQNPGTVRALRVQIDQLRGARAALMEEIETRFPDYTQLINPKTGGLEQARALLTPGEALISTYVGRERSYVWAIGHQGPAAFAALNSGREDIDDTVALLRSALEPSALTLGDIPEFDFESAYDLYSELLGPVEAAWKPAKSLLIVAHGPLGYLPLSVLPTAPFELPFEDEPLFANYRKAPWLARTHAVTVLPSVASLKTLRNLPPGSSTRKSFAGFGDPTFNILAGDDARIGAMRGAAAQLAGGGLMRSRGLPVRLRSSPKTLGLDSAVISQLPQLPDTSDEINSIALALNADLTRDVFLGQNASEDVIKTMDLSGYKVLAFATHGLIPGELDGLTQPALALSAPNITGGDGDGLLTMDEILGLRLDADWVVLSACNTGSGQGAGAEAVSGLGRAFFYAGTRALLVSNWPVETTSAKKLTTDLFARQAADAGLSRAEALRQTMIALMDGDGYVDAESGKAIFAYSHPIFWAPFSLIGDGGTSASE